MKFRLLESIPTITKDDIDKWNRGNGADRITILKKLLKDYNKRGLDNIESAIYAIFDYHGINASNNPFIEFFDKLEFIPQSSHINNFKKLDDLYIRGDVDLKHDYLYLKSLYDRPVKDFESTVLAFETVLNKEKLSKYYNDISYISEDQFLDEHGNILPLGRKDDTGIDSIYGVINQWKTTDSGKSNIEDISDTYRYSLQDALRSFKVPVNLWARVSSEWVKVYFEQATEKYINPAVDDKQYYVEQTLSALTEKSVRLTDARKKSILREKSFNGPDDVPYSERYEGNIVYLRPHDLSKLEADYFVYHNGKFVQFDDYLESVSQDRRSILLNTKSISVVNDKPQIVAGIIRVIDNGFNLAELEDDITTYI